MEKYINFGNVKVNAFEYAVSGNIIFGTRSAGKTTTLKFIAESLMDLNIPLTIIDPIGKMRYLKNPNPNNREGKGYNIILVGKNGDVELSLDTVEDVLRMALQTRSSIIFDLYAPEYLEIREEVVERICKVLLFENEPFGLRNLMLDESGEFVHQENKKTGASVWLERLIRISGNVKVGVTLVHQEPETISKKVVKLCRNRIVGCQTEFNSIENMRKWMDRAGIENSDLVSESLPSLKSGEFYVWSFETNELVKTKIPQIKSLHPSRNTITEKDVKPAEDFQSVIFQMNNIQKVANSVFTPSIIIERVLPEIKNFEIFVNWESVSKSDYLIMVKALNARYGNINVKEIVERLVKKGYTRFISTGRDSGRLESDKQSYTLHNKVECDYAQTLLKLSGF